MSREQEIQDELDKYWGQLDRVEKMLKWIVCAFQVEFRFESMTSTQKEEMENIVKLCPDISDIFGGK